MTSTLLLSISLLLHLFTFFWIINLIQKINLKSPNDTKEIERIKSEIEDVLLSYTAEMKEENEKLVLEMKKLKIDNNQMIKRMEMNKEEEPIEIPNKLNAQRVFRTSNAYKVNTQPTNQKPKRESYEEYNPPVIEDEKENDIFEQSDTAKILALAEQGNNAEQIAKKLSLGKGEVELVLKFYR